MSTSNENDLLVVRFVAPNMGSGIDKPGEMKCYGIAGDSCGIPGHPWVLTPCVNRYRCW